MTLEFLFAEDGVAALGAGRMPSRWFGWVLSRHCPEVKRGISIFTVFEEPCF
jgi:hypothetical protein